MVIRIKTGKNVAGAIRYNELKVTKGEAEQLAAPGFASREQAFASLFYKTKTLEARAQKNARVQKPALHVSLSFHPSERPTDMQLISIAHEYMEGIGYERQPYLVYRHDDTAHPHMHVVTVAIDEDGKKISDSFLNERSNTVRQRLEKNYGLIVAQGRGKQKATELGKSVRIEQVRKPTKWTLEEEVNRVLTQDSVTSFQDFEDCLAKQNVKVRRYEVVNQHPGLLFQRSNGRKAISRAIKASQFSAEPRGKPIFKNLEAVFRERVSEAGTQEAGISETSCSLKVDEVSLTEMIGGEGRGGDALSTEELTPQYQKKKANGSKKRRGRRLGHSPDHGLAL